MYNLGLNTGFAVNRYTNCESWTRLVNKCGIDNVQFTADLINPSLPNDIIKSQLKRLLNIVKNIILKFLQLSREHTQD